jgi:hypothetical protein
MFSWRQSAIGAVDARHGRNPLNFGPGFQIEKLIANGRGWRPEPEINPYAAVL